MISSASTLFLAALVLTTSVSGAPIRLPAAAPSDVVARAESVPQLVPKATVVVDVQPVHRRSGLGMFSRRSARLLTEREPVLEIFEAPVAREPELVEEPQEVRRRYPRRVYHEYYEKREPQPEIIDTPAPVVQKREPEERARTYPRRVYYERYEKRSPSPEPAIKIKETTVTVTKISTFDNAEDLAAANSEQLISGGSVGTTESTLLSQSQTQTIQPPGSDATAAGVVAEAGTAPSATTTAAASVVTVSGSATSTASGSVVTETAASSTASASVVTATGTSSTATASAVTVTGSATPATVTESVVTATATPSAVVSTTSGSTNTSTGGATTVEAVNPQPPPVTGDGSKTEVVNPRSPTVAVTPGRRDMQGTTNGEPPVLRRSAYSGAAWASFVRRQSN